MAEYGPSEAARFLRFAELLRGFAAKCEEEGFPAYAQHLREDADFAEDATLTESSSPDREGAEHAQR